MLEILSFPVFFLIICSFYAICCLGLNIQYGFTGLFNVGIAGFFGVGAYTSAILSGPRYPDTLIGGFELPIILSWLAAIVISAFSGLLVGFITLRLREDFLAISTFGIAITLQLIALNLESFTRGPNGLYGLPKPLSDWSEDPVVDNILFLLIAFVVITALYLSLERIYKSPWGRVLRS
ncbi:MAG: branched-chain amino acid ABC transporter permease, partial [SAR324 cluster bacterium]|nr:branched-chain amino acid ABC transporter permease [SAR324 cluster bacterium]